MLFSQVNLSVGDIINLLEAGMSVGQLIGYLAAWPTKPWRIEHGDQAATVRRLRGFPQRPHWRERC